MPWVEAVERLIGVLPWIAGGGIVAAIVAGLVVDVLLPTLTERRHRHTKP